MFGESESLKVNHLAIDVRLIICLPSMAMSGCCLARKWFSFSSFWLILWFQLSYFAADHGSVFTPF